MINNSEIPLYKLFYLYMRSFGLWPLFLEGFNQSAIKHGRKIDDIWEFLKTHEYTDYLDAAFIWAEFHPEIRWDIHDELWSQLAKTLEDRIVNKKELNIEFAKLKLEYKVYTAP